MNGFRCPRCTGFGVAEPAGIRCLLRGCWTPFLRTLPREHVSGIGKGWDWKSRARQRAIDAMYERPGRAREIMADFLERLDPREEDAIA